MTPPDPVAGYLRERADLLATASPGPEASRALSDLTDGVVSDLAEAALSSLSGPWAVLALGGWGAGRLLPGSDLDLLVVTDTSAERLRPALERMLYPLWDAGLQVGHQVRSASEHQAATRADIRTLTATLTGRPLAGDLALAERVLRRSATDASRRRRRVLRELAARERSGSPYLLEPDLKEGAGGQRDLDEMTWTAAVLLGVPAAGPEGLVPAGMLTPDLLARIAAAGDAVTEARWALQAATGRSQSRLDLDAAEDVGLDLHVLQAALADIHHVLLRTRERIAASRPGDRVPAGRRRAVYPEPGAQPVGRDVLFALLDGGERAVPELEDAAWSGRLDDLLPGMSDLMTLRRPGLTHTLTVGAHSLRCAVAVRGLRGRASGEDGARAAGSPDIRLRTVQAAALLHDTGKVHSGPGHPQRGAAIAATVLPRLGLDPASRADAALLVREHLLLSEVAATMDIHDEDVIVRAAARVGRADLVDLLYALTAADAMATGPDTWTPWHAVLIGELADRLSAAAGPDALGAGVAARAERTRSAAARLAADDADPRVEAFIASAHLRYLARRRPDQVLAHARLAAEAADARAPRSEVTPGPAAGSWSVTVAAPDREGLFAAIAGSLALAGMDILSADADSAPAGIAVDTFVVRTDTLAEAGPSTWAAFDRYLAAAAAGRLDLEPRLEKRRREYPRKASRPTAVWVEPTAAYATAVHVTAADRIGLLHDIARGIAEAGMNIRWVRATTRGGVARDVFHVVDHGDEPVDDPGVLGHLAMRIRERA